MKKIIFYVSFLIFIYQFYVIINIFVYHFANLNDYGNGFLIGKMILVLILIILIYKTNPFKKIKK